MFDDEECKAEFLRWVQNHDVRKSSGLAIKIHTVM